MVNRMSSAACSVRSGIRRGKRVSRKSEYSNLLVEYVIWLDEAKYEVNSLYKLSLDSRMYLVCTFVAEERESPQSFL